MRRQLRMVSSNLLTKLTRKGSSRTTSASEEIENQQLPTCPEQPQEQGMEGILYAPNTPKFHFPTQMYAYGYLMDKEWYNEMTIEFNKYFRQGAVFHVAFGYKCETFDIEGDENNYCLAITTNGPKFQGRLPSQWVLKFVHEFIDYGGKNVSKEPRWYKVDMINRTDFADHNDSVKYNS